LEVHIQTKFFSYNLYSLSQQFYSCIRFVVRGQYGVLHRAIERATGRNWVAKFVACTLIERAMVRQEIDLRNDTRHPRLLQLHEAFEIHGEFAFILEL
jgi:hypothetical protein